MEGLKDKKGPSFIHEFKHSILVLGDHQFFKGYSVLLFKNHARDITDLDPLIQNEFFKELMLSGKAVKKAFHSNRINYSCLGNFVEHIHYHIFPRTDEDLEKDEDKNPWSHSDKFSEYLISEKEMLERCRIIKENISSA